MLIGNYPEIEMIINMVKQILVILVIVLSIPLSGCGRVSSEEASETFDNHTESCSTGYVDTSFTDISEEIEKMDDWTIWKSDPENDARFHFEVATKKTVFSCNEFEFIEFNTVIVNNGDPFYTCYYGYFADCRLISKQGTQTIIIEMETEIPAEDRYETIESGQRSEKHIFSAAYATIIDEFGVSRKTDDGELPEGRYYIEVFYNNCYVPENGTYPEMICDEYVSEVFTDAEIIIHKEID